TAQIALNGVYYNFAAVDGVHNVTRWLEHEVPPGMFAGLLAYGYGADFAESNQYANSSYSDVHWDNSYAIINAANGVITGVNQLPDNKFTGNRKKEMLAEAKFLRAYSNFKLLSYYGQWYGILLRNDFVTVRNISGVRGTVAQAYDSIFADVNEAIDNGPTTNPNYYMNRWAAMALKIRVLLSHGQAADFPVAIALADSIIQHGGYALEPNLKDLFYSKGLASQEVILGIQPQQNQEQYYYCLSRQYWPGASSLYVATAKLLTLLQDDPRRWMVGSENMSGPGTYYFLKYIAENTTATPLSETAYAFRLSEVYLLKAEAIVRSGGSLADARAILQEVMTHAGVTDFTAINNATTTDEMRKQIYLEIARNLVGEDGQEWMALLRLPLAMVKELRPTIKDQIMYTLPVPHAEFVYNPAFGDQNPGYQK
ncbi:MAG TPA: RagB/SusD family nutrient uptake outer membrane protein, partial [Chitinophaga sp.]